MIAPAYRYRAEVLSVYDGDTVTLRVDLGFDVYTVAQVRLRGINAPEVHGPTKAAGLAAEDWLSHELAATTVVVETAKAPRTGRSLRSFTRWVADVWVGDDLVADLMVAAGHATFYPPSSPFYRPPA